MMEGELDIPEHEGQDSSWATLELQLYGPELILVCCQEGIDVTFGSFMSTNPFMTE